ncbi:MAG: twin-arginine translocation signal domain-containing protein [Verrucomicrobiota bacterium]
MNSSTSKATGCSSRECGCYDQRLGRRDFIKHLGLGAAVLAMQPWNLAMAGPFTRADFDQLVPADRLGLCAE